MFNARIPSPSGRSPATTSSQRTTQAGASAEATSSTHVDAATDAPPRRRAHQGGSAPRNAVLPQLQFVPYAVPQQHATTRGRATLNDPEHQALMATLAPRLMPTLTRPERSHFKSFLGLLERTQRRWTQLAPTSSAPQPQALVLAVDDAISNHGIHRNLRSALNKAFGTSLVAPGGGGQRLLPEHDALMNSLPANTSVDHRKAIKRLLRHLQSLGMAWSMVAPQPGDVRPAVLAGIIDHNQALAGSTRAALNSAFGLALVGPSGQVRLAPVLQRHQDILRTVPAGTPHYSPVNRLLCHLEQLGTSWDAVVPDPRDHRPRALEDIVNTGTALGVLNVATRSSLNVVFNMTLRA